MHPQSSSSFRSFDVMIFLAGYVMLLMLNFRFNFTEDTGSGKFRKISRIRRYLFLIFCRTNGIKQTHSAKDINFLLATWQIQCQMKMMPVPRSIHVTEFFPIYSFHKLSIQLLTFIIDISRLAKNH